jgi:hypothetical protein
MMDKNWHLFMQYFDSLVARSEEFAEKYMEYRGNGNSSGMKPGSIPFYENLEGLSIHEQYRFHQDG